MRYGAASEEDHRYWPRPLCSDSNHSVARRGSSLVNIMSSAKHVVTPQTSCCALSIPSHAELPVTLPSSRRAPNVQSGGQISVGRQSIAHNPAPTLRESGMEECCGHGFLTWPHYRLTLCYSASHGSSQLRAPLATEDCGTQSRHYTEVGSGSSGSVGGTGCKRRRTPLCPVVAVSLHKIYPVIPADLLSTVSTSTCPGWPSLLLPFLVLRCPVRSYLYSSPRLHVLLTLLYFTMTIISRFGLQLLFGSL